MARGYSARNDPPMPLIDVDDRGLACKAGGFWVDPWKPAPTAVITHGHEIGRAHV